MATSGLALACICLPWSLLSPCALSALAPGQRDPVPWPQGSSSSSAQDLTAPVCQRELNYKFSTRAKKHAQATACTQMPLPRADQPLPTSLSLLCSSPGSGHATEGRPLPVKSSAALAPLPICPTCSQQQAKSSALSQAIPFTTCPQAA